jgi:hypothetical protein
MLLKKEKVNLKKKKKKKKKKVREEREETAGLCLYPMN